MISHALILAAHGSRLTSSNDEVAALAAQLSSSLEHHFDLVLPAFLELAEPSIEQAIATAVKSGHQQITVMPYFLAAGRHVKDDVPHIVEQACRQYPETSIHLTKHLGLSSALVTAISALLPPK